MTTYQPNRIDRIFAALLTAFLLSGPVLAQENADGHGGRIAPPVGVSCDRDQLTSWTGEVTGYRRDETSIWIQISTDENTVEETAIEHRGFADASTHYLLWGEPFTNSDWLAIEAAPGELLDGMRATVWTCSDGRTPPVIDWRPDRN